MGRDFLKAWAILPQIALVMLTPILLCILLGHFLDGLLGTEVLFLIIFTVLGVGAAFRSLYVFCMKTLKEDEKRDKKNKTLDIKKITGNKRNR
ncbi:MAG: AtpZ/AtpI family protein [Clostridiales bacterium]|nr:AtpZ/AtpI family protein [Clostridiales bacterium]